MNEEGLKKYAELLVRAGGNVQPGQLVVLSAPVEHAAFARTVQTVAYDAGAGEVVIDWRDDASTRTEFLRGADAIFDEVPPWRVERFKYLDERGAVYLNLVASDPDLLAGVDADRIRRRTKATSTAFKPHAMRTMSNAQRWSLMALPCPAWAKKVFPNLSEAEAIDRLWAGILKGARADGADPIADWAAHKKSFDRRVAYLNEQAFDALRFTNSLGTDFAVGLAKGHIWAGGGDRAQDGVDFFPNIPTEEIFTMPDRARAEGRVVASMPLSYQGSLIENFEIMFEAGRAVSWKAAANETVLTNIMETDEGVRHLGEVALVPGSSPIAQMGVLFYNTLFDENASCHLALGRAYPNNIKGGVKMTDAEKLAAGMNDSLLHVDFMFGTSDMQITGIKTDGTETVFFKQGEFVI